MQKINVKKLKNITDVIKGEIQIPSDKSITHRAFIFASLCNGTSIIKNPLLAEDCICTLKALGALGVKYQIDKNFVTINGVDGIKGFKNPVADLYLGNSGTGARLLAGLLAGAEGLNVTITGDDSLSKRPMKRIIDPLTQMGAEIKARENNFLPMQIIGKKLHGINYTLPMPSAQVKSAILLAGLYSDGETVIHEKIKSRNHTEKMLEFLKFNFKEKNVNELYLSSKNESVDAKIFNIPNDISSSAFFLVLGILTSKEGLVLKNIGLNPTRIGIINVLKRMGAFIEITNMTSECGEEVGDIFVKKSKLKGTIITEQEIPLLVDEIPIIALAGIFAEGQTIVHNAGELRHKESDRLEVIKNEFSKFGADIKEHGDDLIVTETDIKNLKGAQIFAHYDHRIAMTAIIAGLMLEGETEIDDISCINTSFPTFFDCLKQAGVSL
jgi:3-phosphoshikimate 1-carboxyvinyltransferase